jgi:hypothetical protein
MDLKKNEYRSAPNRPGPANDPAAIKRFNLKNDQVSVVHSGESDPMPNQEAQEAYEDSDTDENDFEAQQKNAEEGDR